MSNVGYDLDTSGGLMPLIRQLIKPPDDEQNGQKAKKSQHPYYKRPGRGHNHDSCDACEEGGDLICCDRCPASFHLGCHDPPLEEADIPAGQWLCKECRSAEAERPSSTRSSRAHSPADADKGNRSLRTKRSASSQSKKSDKESKSRSDSKVKEEDPDEEETKEKEKSEKKKKKLEEEKDMTPMEILVKAARIMNPKQFELPREMRVYCPFPGTDKEPSSNGNNNGSLVTTDAWGLVPLPAKSCFVCSATCKQAPLLQCDYCSLLFHQDCLDPPLTALPTGRWMCPNHVEQYIDWKLVNSISATERVALWERFSGPVDQHAIKIDFIRHARRARPPFRIKVPISVRGRVSVPEMVRYHYKTPPPLLPSRREYVRCRNVLKQARGYKDDQLIQDDGRKQKICLNLHCPQYYSGDCNHEADYLGGAKRDEAADDLRAIKEGRTSTFSLKRSSLDELFSSSDDDDDDDSGVKRRKTSTESEEEVIKEAKLEPPIQLKTGNGAEEILAVAEEQLKRLDDRLVKILAWQRLQQVLTGERCAGPWRREPLCERAEKLVHDSIDRTRLTRYGFRHVSLPSQLLSRADHERIAQAIWGAPTREPLADPPRSPGHSLSDAAVRATLCPVERPAKGGLGDGLGRPVPMRLSRLSVGWGSECDVVLTRYGHCKYTSKLHAVIFYDEVSRHFELMNYASHGTRVNGALYACSVVDAAPAADSAESEARAAQLRAIAHRHAVTIKFSGDLTTGPVVEACRCPPPRPELLTSGWDGTAILQHGTLLQFGCLMFVFSITDTLLPGNQ